MVAMQTPRPSRSFSIPMVDWQTRRLSSPNALQDELSALPAKIEESVRALICELKHDLRNVVREELLLSQPKPRTLSVEEALEFQPEDPARYVTISVDGLQDVTNAWARRNVLVSRAHHIARKFGGQLEQGNFHRGLGEKTVSMISEDTVGEISVSPSEASRSRVMARRQSGFLLSADLLPPRTFFDRQYTPIGRTRSNCEDFLEGASEYLPGIIMVAVVLNAITIGIETDYQARTGSVPMFLTILEYVFCVLYVVELAIRLFLERWSFFHHAWNHFDLAVVALQVIEIALQVLLAEGRSPIVVGFLRSFRIVRIIRVTRIMRHHWPELYFIEDLRTLVFSILGTLSSFCWTWLILCFVIYSMSICFTQIVLQHMEASDRTEHAKEVELYFGSLPRTALTFFECITGGLSWDAAVVPLIYEVSPAMGLFFCFYVCFCVCAILNVVTGVFVEQATARAMEDKREFLERHLTKVFRSTDADNSGFVDWNEFESKLGTEEIQSYFRTLDIDVSEAKGIFQLLDADNSGHIDGVEFVSGCMRLQGPAKALELKLLMNLTARLQDYVVKHFDVVETKLARVLKILGLNAIGEPECRVRV